MLISFYNAVEVVDIYRQLHLNNTEEKAKFTHPLQYANAIEAIIPEPSFRSHVIVAASGVALPSPTPSPVSVACRLRAPAMLLQ